MVAGKKLHGQDQIIVSLAVGPVSSGSSIEVKDNFVNRVAEKCGGAVVRIQTEQKAHEPKATLG